MQIKDNLNASSCDLPILLHVMLTKTRLFNLYKVVVVFLSNLWVSTKSLKVDFQI